MKTELVQPLQQVAEETFQSLAFMFSMGPDESGPAQAPGAITAVSVAFAGPFGGQVVLWVTDDMLPPLAGNMLGLDDGEAATAEQQHDALKELLNVICGNLLPAIAGCQEVFNVRTPQVVQPKPAEAPDFSGAAAVAALTLDSGMAQVALYLE